jgi:hypothetical protein
LRSPKVSETDLDERLGRSPRPLRLGDLLDLEAVLDVLLHRHVREQRVVLEDRVDVALEGWLLGHVDAGELDGAGRGQLEAGDHAQDRGLARA